MSLKVTITNSEDEAVVIKKENVRKVVYSTDVPLDSEARTKDVGSTLTIYGRILDEDNTIDLDDWSLVAAEKDCYRHVLVEVASAALVIRSYEFPNAFVVNYEEDYSAVEGVGTFVLTVKQKKDKMAGINIRGAFEYTPEDEG